MNTPPPDFQALLRWAPLLIVGFVLLNAAIIHRRMGQLVATGRLSPQDRRAFTRGLAAFGVIGGVEVALLQWLAPDRSLFDAVRLPPTTVAGAVHWTFVGTAYAAWFAWLWRGRGAGLLASVSPALGRQENYRRQVSAPRARLWGTVLGALTLLGNVFGALFMPLTPGQ